MRKLLIVDDDEEEILQHFQNHFLLEGWEVFLARKAKEGLGLSLKERPDLILLDLQLPDLSGEELLRKIRDVLPDTKVFIQTWKVEPGLKQRMIKLGASAFVFKGEARVEELERMADRMIP